LPYRVLDDTAKRRLTDPVEIERAVRILKDEGYDETGALVELLKMFYLDLDEYAEVVRAA
jgi:hypothetical protein